MKTLTFIGCTLGIGISLSACRADPILLGELIEAAERGDEPGEPGVDEADDNPPSADPNVPTRDPHELDNPEFPVPYPTDLIAAEDMVEDILLTYCGECHQAPADEGNLSAIGDVDELIDLGLIIPGSKHDSPIYARMASGTMPPFSEDDLPTDPEIVFVGSFIDAMDD
jgi:hypothetical protein